MLGVLQGEVGCPGNPLSSNFDSTKKHASNFSSNSTSLALVEWEVAFNMELEVHSKVDLEVEFEVELGGGNASGIRDET